MSAVKFIILTAFMCHIRAEPLQLEIDKSLEILYAEPICREIVPRVIPNWCFAYDLNVSNSEPSELVDSLADVTQEINDITINIETVHETLLRLIQESSRNLAEIEKNLAKLDRGVKYLYCVQWWWPIVGDIWSQLWCSLRTSL
jgi:hypothetical protein